MVNQPQEIHEQEWQEIMELPIVIDMWGLTSKETVEEFSSMVYGVNSISKAIAQVILELFGSFMAAHWAYHP